MHNTGKHSIGRFLMIGIGWTMLVIIVATIVVYFSWNMAMPELFGAVPMSFTNAFGLVLLAAMASWILGRGVVGRNVNLRRRMWKEKMWREKEKMWKEKRDQGEQDV